eukprot:4469963-Pleurochrysis_carterae.AAC.3
MPMVAHAIGPAMFNCPESVPARAAISLLFNSIYSYMQDAWSCFRNIWIQHVSPFNRQGFCGNPERKISIHGFIVLRLMIRHKISHIGHCLLRGAHIPGNYGRADLASASQLR